MESHVNIRVLPDTFASAQALAVEKHLDVNDLVEHAVQRGLNMLRQELFFEERKRRAHRVTAEEARAILDRAGRNNPPDPGDEIPEDLRHLYPAPPDPA